MRPEFENPMIQHENRLPARSVMLPAQKSGIDYRTKEDSERVQSLCGAWKFLYIENDLDYEDGNAARGDFSGWEDIPVPSEWQFCGCGVPRYTNVDYPYPFNPPYVGYDNPVGIYRRKFVLSKQAKNRLVTLHFDGVDGAFNVYVNGTYIGFSKGSRIPAEFDITDALGPGENDITVEIWTYSDAQYLENQDMWMANGIFRDVYLLFENEVGLWDYELKTTTDSLAVVLYPRNGAADLRAELTFDRRTRKCDLAYENSVKFDLPSPEPWNAEHPYLYELVITVLRGDIPIEIHTKKVGLRESAIIDGLFCVNGAPIVFCGTNRHEFHPEKGRAIDPQQIERELGLLKACNFNAIRTSHYPQHPAFYEICSELGIYVVDEADIESHGCSATWDQGFLAKHDDWAGAFLDRTERMYMRDKNETCVVVWSIGNEAGSGKNIDACAAWLRSRLNKKPILQAQDDNENPRISDFRQYGYPNMETVRRFAEMESDFPAISTEYGHAMGNSPGALSDMWDVIDETPQMQGGFVWEFKNHGFAKKLENGETAYLYGGDFDEGPNWANFLLDGYCFSDGTPKPSMYEIKYLMAPLRIRDRDGALSVYCRNSFERLDNVTMIWSLNEDTTVLDSGTKTGLNFGPGDTVKIPYPAVLPERRIPGAQYLLNVMLFAGERDLGYAQIVLGREEPNGSLSEGAVVCSTTEGVKIGSAFCEGTSHTTSSTAPRFSSLGEGGLARRVTLAAGDITTTFTDGMLSRIASGERVLLDRPMKLSFYRVNTDNDGIICGIRKRHLRDIWDDHHLDKPVFQLEKQEISEERGVTLLKCIGKIVFEGLYQGFFAEIVYRIYPDCTVSVCIEGKPYGMLPDVLPRIGVTFETEKSMDAVKWYGRGWQENYPDRKACTLIGKFDADVPSMSVHYERPQDNGVRCDTQYVGLIGDGNCGLLFSAYDRFSFAVHDYSMEALRAADHRHALIKDEKHNHLYLDYAVRGLGSNSCGPEPEEEYELHPHAFRFAFAVSPWRGEDDALLHARSVFGQRSAALGERYKFEFDPQKNRENFDCRI
ncbi:MAG: hypothetical protein E7604_09065 [Ruminococcaceae bacterium]|nr:hypothetical protein [Oscillospiraceae bacterium]